MGDVIRTNAAVEDIFKDARTALTNGIAKGGTAKDRAESGLGPIIAMIDAIEAELKTARELLAPLLAALNAENEKADATIDRIYDDTWNDVDRPANDRYLALMFPGAPATTPTATPPGNPHGWSFSPSSMIAISTPS